MSSKKQKNSPDQPRSEEQRGQQAAVREPDNAAINLEQESEEQLLRRCQERICPQCPELAKEHDERLRALADTENLKKRLQREKEDFCKFATQSVLEDLLPVLDNLDLALEHGRKIEGCTELTHGVEMTRKIFLDILARHDLEPLGGAGEDFDPAWHEALGQQPHPDIAAGKICQLVQKGYRLKGRLLRPAKVLVSQECPK
ncbi:MAG TPA: nucleotide exchange factor GrpE [Desulfonatronum sp.]|nr:nucleotide exchange factor GrpE [Desulfonatronum sp.]